MSSFQRKLSILVMLSIICAMPCMAFFVPLFAQDSDTVQSKLRALLEERRETLKTRVELIEKHVAMAGSSPESLIAARGDLLDAELELAITSHDRIAVLRRKLDNAKQLESLMQERKLAAKATEAGVLMAKADRLRVEIDLLREMEPQVK